MIPGGRAARDTTQWLWSARVSVFRQCFCVCVGVGVGVFFVWGPGGWMEGGGCRAQEKGGRGKRGYTTGMSGGEVDGNKHQGHAEEKGEVGRERGIGRREGGTALSERGTRWKGGYKMEG